MLSHIVALRRGAGPQDDRKHGANGCELLEWPHTTGRKNVVTPNYGYEKRQKELAKKRKKEEKLKEKAQRKQAGAGDGTPEDAEAPSTGAPADGDAAQP
jgi:hypothetical protein